MPDILARGYFTLPQKQKCVSAVSQKFAFSIISWTNWKKRNAKVKSFRADTVYVRPFEKFVIFRGKAVMVIWWYNSLIIYESQIREINVFLRQRTISFIQEMIEKAYFSAVHLEVTP